MLLKSMTNDRITSRSRNGSVQPDTGHFYGSSALLQIVGGDKLIIPFADGAAHEPIQSAGIFSVILWAVRWYCKYGISYRELQEMLAERGVNVRDSLMIYRWVQRYAPEMEKRLRWYWRNPSDLCPWHG